MSFKKIFFYSSYLTLILTLSPYAKAGNYKEIEVETKIEKENNESFFYLQTNPLNLNKEEKKENEKEIKYLLNTKENSKIKVKEFVYKKVYVKGNNVNIRILPNLNSKVVDKYSLNKEIMCCKINENWYRFEVGNKARYISANFVSKEKVTYRTYPVPSNSGFKSFMPYSVNGRSIFCSTSKQRKLQDNFGYSGKYGIRQVDDRFCVAIGSYFTTDIGTYFDLVLENGTVIPCILADGKANCDTDANNIITVHDGSVAEFIVDMSILNSNAKRDGDISSCTSDWNSPISEIIVYNKNVLE